MSTLLSTAGFSGVNGTHFELRLEYDVSQSQSGNYSDITYYLKMRSKDGYSGSGTAHNKGSINGVEVGEFTSIGVNTTIDIGQRTIREYHNNDGTKTVSFSASINTAWNLGSASTTGTLTLPKINRGAYTTSVEGNDIEGSFKVNYTTYVTGYTYKLRISIPHVVLLDRIDYNTSGESFTLSNEVITELLSRMTTTDSISLGFAVETWSSDGETRISEGNEVIITGKLYNINPTFDAVYEDSNPTTVAITGDDQKLIRNNSTLQIDVTNMAALKGASLSSLKVSIEGTTYNGSVGSTSYTFNIGTLNLSTSVNALVTLTDSRGLSTTITLPLDILDWQLPTGIITLGRQSNFYSATDIKVDADYSSLGGLNTISIKVRTKKTTDVNYGAYTTLTDNVTSTLTLDNLYSWDVQVLVEDLIGSTTYNLTVGIGLPILYVDRLKRSVSVECFPQDSESLEVKGVNVLDTISTHTSQINGLKGEILWENQSPTTTFLPQTITLSSDDYDLLEIFFYDYIGTTRMNSVRFPKGEKTNMFSLFDYNSGMYMGRRTANNDGDTTITISGCYSAITNSQINVQLSNEWMIPVYVVGYKTGLFQ